MFYQVFFLIKQKELKKNAEKLEKDKKRLKILEQKYGRTIQDSKALVFI